MNDYNENLVRMAEPYLQNGIPLILYHGVTPDGICSCRKSNCNHIGKHPVFFNPTEKKIADLSALKTYLDDRSYRNLAALVANGSGLFVIDVDKKNGGLESYDRFIADFGQLPKTTKVLTGGGGFHLYFKLPKSFANQKIPIGWTKYEGVEFFTNKNLVIPGSRHHSKNIYQFDASEESKNFVFAEIPEIFLKEIQGSSAAVTKSTLENTDSNFISEGNRNNSMFKFALELLGKSDSEEDAWSLLQTLNTTRCNPALDESELRSTFESAKKRHADSGPYYFHDGFTYYKKEGVPQKLGNFHIVLKEQLKIDDGSGDPPSNIYVLIILHPKIYPDIIKVTPEQLENGSYVEYP